MTRTPSRPIDDRNSLDRACTSSLLALLLVACAAIVVGCAEEEARDEPVDAPGDCFERSQPFSSRSANVDEPIGVGASFYNFCATFDDDFVGLEVLATSPGLRVDAAWSGIDIGEHIYGPEYRSLRNEVVVESRGVHWIIFRSAFGHGYYDSVIEFLVDEPTTVTCDLARPNGGCSADAYCHTAPTEAYPMDCRDAPTTGICRPRPTAGESTDGVHLCGCDGAVYTSSREARANGYGGQLSTAYHIHEPCNGT